MFNPTVFFPEILLVTKSEVLAKIAKHFEFAAEKNDYKFSCKLNNWKILC